MAGIWLENNTIGYGFSSGEKHQVFSHHHGTKHPTCTLAVRGLELEEHIRITRIFERIISFMLFTVLLSHMYFIYNFFLFMILTESVGLVPFPAE